MAGGDPPKPGFYRGVGRGSSLLLETGRPDDGWLYEHLVTSSRGVNRPVGGLVVCHDLSSDISLEDGYRSAQGSSVNSSPLCSGRRRFLNRLEVEDKDKKNPLISSDSSETRFAIYSVHSILKLYTQVGIVFLKCSKSQL